MIPHSNLQQLNLMKIYYIVWKFTVSKLQWMSWYLIYYTVWNVSKYGVFSDPYFPTFGLNTKRYEASLCIQSKCGKIRTRKNSVFGHFSRSVIFQVEGRDHRGSLTIRNYWFKLKYFRNKKRKVLFWKKIYYCQ